MRKTFLVILILSLLLLTTAISASAAGFNVTIYNNRVPEFAIAFTDNLEGVLGIFYTGESYKDSYGSLSGSIMTLSLGGRYYLNNVGKTSPFVYASYSFPMYFRDWKNPYNKCYFLEGGLGLAYNLDANWAVVGRTGLGRDFYQEKETKDSKASWGNTYSIGLMYSF